MPKFPRIEFEFLCATGKSQTLYGSVIVRNDEMLLDIESPGDRPYDVRGKDTGLFFRGNHVGRPGDSAVDAKWILLDDTYVGRWVEDGYEFFFHFQLPTIA